MARRGDPTPTGGDERGADLQAALLGRLERLLERRDGRAAGARRESWLLNRAIRTAYRDCVAIGATSQACALLEQAETRRWSSAGRSA